MAQTDQEHLELAREHRAQGRLVEAEKAYGRHVQVRPDDAQGWNEMGIVLGQLGKYDGAIAAFATSIKIFPASPGPHQNLAMAYERKGDLERAERSCRTSLSIDPNSASCWDALGGLLASGGRMLEAAGCFGKALQLQPESVQTTFRLGKSLYMAGDTDRAIPLLQAAARAEPENLDTLYVLALAQRQASRFDDAMDTLNQLLAMDADYLEALGTQSMLYLLRGDFERGWKGYERRWESKSFPDKKREYTQPQWTGQDLAGKTILTYAEQGAGDIFMFARYVPLIAQRGAKVVLECPSDLVPVVKTVEGVSQTILKGTAFDAFDFHCPLLSLPFAFGTRVETIPSRVPYVSVLPQYGAEWVARLEPYANEFKVGLVWSGNPKHPNDKYRSSSLAAFAPLGSAEGVRLFSLQKGPGAAQAFAPPAGMKLVNLTAAMSHFGDTAAFIANLDLVISVDTAVAHLAGAMGKAVWLLLPKPPDFRWLLDRDDSPWYPTMRLFRQDSLGDWAGVLIRVAEELKKIVGKKELQK